MFSMCLLINVAMLSLALELVSVNAIHCYQCNSVDAPQCNDLSSLPTRLASGFYKECKEYGDKLPFCRKIVLLNVLAGNETHTIRSCGLEKYDIDQTICYRVDNENHAEISCQCFNDGCNGSNEMRVFSAAAFFILSVFVCIF